MRAKKLSHSIDEYCGHLHTGTSAEQSDVERKHGMNLKKNFKVILNAREKK